MRVRSKGAITECVYDGEDSGEGLAIILGQEPSATARFRFDVFAVFGAGSFLVGTFFSSPPTATNPIGATSRMVGAAVCPGAKGWKVLVSGPESYLNTNSEGAEVFLQSSDCPTSPVGVTRVNERYSYAAGATTDTGYTVPAGQRITSYTATAPTVAGSVILGTGQAIIVPAGQSIGMRPGAGLLMSNSFTFSNVDWVIEFLESA